MIPELAGSEIRDDPATERRMCVIGTVVLRSYGGDVKYVRFGLGASQMLFVYGDIDFLVPYYKALKEYT